jgi:hypothetical protein
MDPKDIVQGLADGLTRFVQSYLEFVLLSVVSPLREFTKQHYLSTWSPQKGISAVSHLFLAVVIAVYICAIPLFDAPNIESSFGSITHSSANGALVPELITALVVTVMFDLIVNAFCRLAMSTQYRAKRLCSLIELASASALIWSAILLRACIGVGIWVGMMYWSDFFQSGPQPDLPGWEKHLLGVLERISLSSFAIILSSDSFGDILSSIYSDFDIYGKVQAPPPA